MTASAAGDGDVLALLRSAPLTARGFLAQASNHTLLVQAGSPPAGTHAIYKPQAGERPLWDFPEGTLCRREVAAYEVSDFLGWQLVPPTVLRDGPMGFGSVQLFIPHDPARHYFVLLDAEPRHRTALARMALFDMLVNNADRKAGHVLRADDGHVWGIDHGLTFHVQTKLRTVIWELGGTPIPPDWHRDLARLDAALDNPGHATTGRLEALLSPQEIEGLAMRARALTEIEALPAVDEHRRPYPWPPL